MVNLLPAAKEIIFGAAARLKFVAITKPKRAIRRRWRLAFRSRGHWYKRPVFHEAFDFYKTRPYDFIGDNLISR